jgi:translation initiation factor 2-alpha kinase 4
LDRTQQAELSAEKIKLRPEDDDEKAWREVSNLSRVSHPHIVRYYGTWLEDMHPPEPEPSTDDSVRGTTTSVIASEDDEDIFRPNLDDLSLSRRDHSRSASFPRIRFSDAPEDEDDDDDESSEESSDTESDAETVPEPPDNRGRPMAIMAQKPSMSYTDTSTDVSGVKTILYIQMEFVEKVSTQNVRIPTDNVPLANPT